MRLLAISMRAAVRVLCDRTFEVLRCEENGAKMVLLDEFSYVRRNGCAVESHHKQLTQCSTLARSVIEKTIEDTSMTTEVTANDRVQGNRRAAEFLLQRSAARVPRQLIVLSFASHPRI